MANIKVLSKSDVASLLKAQEVIEIVKSVYIQKENQEAKAWQTVFYDFEQGVADMDIKSGLIEGLNIFGSKTVAWFSENEKRALPDLHGIISVFSSITGIPEGIVDGSYITGLRTGAAGAIGALALARKDSKNLMILGAGHQALFQIACTLILIPQIKEVRIVDAVKHQNAENLALSICKKLKDNFGIDASNVKFTPCDNIEYAVSLSDIIITVTPSRSPIIKSKWVKPGTHFSCIGADMEGKQEIESEILKNAIIFVDDKDHCIKSGEIEMGIKEGIITEKDIVGEIGALLLNKAKGRQNDTQTTIFDATGMAILDLATAKLALDKAVEKGGGVDAVL